MKRIVSFILLSILLVALGGCFWVHERDGDERDRRERIEHEHEGGEHEHHEMEESR